MRRKIASFALFALMPFGMLAGVNTIYLKDGRTFSGRFLSGDTGFVSFQDDQGQQYRFRTGEVQSIVFGSQDGDRSSQGNQNYQNDRKNDGRNRNFGAPPASYGSGNRPTAGNMIPAGTQLVIRTSGTIDSRNANDGQVFPASVDQDVMDGNGNVMIPRGSNANLVIRSASNGSIRTSSDLLLDVQDVTVNGQRYVVNTEDLQKTGRAGVGGNRRTAEFVGGGTALGTILGAIAGGGKGAAIGALAGAASGAGAQILTKGNEVKIPSETILTFRLDQPMVVNAANY